MPSSNGVRLVQNFLLPHLEDGTFGQYLKWIDRRKGVFGIYRAHYRKGAGLKNYKDLFKAWSKMKNLWNPNDPQGPSKAKHRFHSALRRHQDIQEMKKKNQYLIYKLNNMEKFFTHDDMSDNGSDLTDDDTDQKDNNDELYVLLHNNAANQEPSTEQDEVHNFEVQRDCSLDTSLEPVFPSPTKTSLTTQDWESLDDTHELMDYLPNCFSSTRCCDIQPDSKTFHNQLCIWSDYEKF